MYLENWIPCCQSVLLPICPKWLVAVLQEKGKKTLKAFLAYTAIIKEVFIKLLKCTTNWKQGKLFLFALWMFKPWRFYICKTLSEPGKYTFMCVMSVKSTGQYTKQERRGQQEKHHCVYSVAQYGMQETYLTYVPDEQFLFMWSGTILECSSYNMNMVQSHYNTVLWVLTASPTTLGTCRLTTSSMTCVQSVKRKSDSLCLEKSLF